MDLNLVVFILKDSKLRAVIEEIKELSSINFVKRNIEDRLSIGILSRSKSKQVVNGGFITSFHGEGLTGSSLSVGEASNNTPVEGHVDQGLDASSVQVFSGFEVRKGVVKLKVVVFHIFSNTINPEFTLVNASSRVSSRDTVDFSGCFLLGENGTFTHAN